MQKIPRKAQSSKGANFPKIKANESKKVEAKINVLPSFIAFKIEGQT